DSHSRTRTPGRGRASFLYPDLRRCLAVRINVRGDLSVILPVMNRGRALFTSAVVVTTAAVAACVPSPPATLEALPVPTPSAVQAVAQVLPRPPSNVYANAG